MFRLDQQLGIDVHHRAGNANAAVGSAKHHVGLGRGEIHVGIGGGFVEEIGKRVRGETRVVNVALGVVRFVGADAAHVEERVVIGRIGGRKHG